ncbi:M1 family metallopeptidase [Mariniflexile ostreae]|uniref:M1 family metallopeptidase n=1 Tax=Mariniflexile ostreae TaxID=1520892 RepID=A0ABV5FDF8_9FLAO
MIFKIYVLIASLLCATFSAQGQSFSRKENFTRQDTLRGSITPERSWWDLTYYHLDIQVKPELKFISGKNTIQYKVLKTNSVMQIDLQAPLKITKAIQNNKVLKIKQDGNAHFITLIKNQNINDINTLDIYYEGHPKEAINAPWDGGISWKKDHKGNPFIASSCQGLGASVWWPCKDHMYDEVDSMLISVNVPKSLINISNGKLRRVEQYGDTKTYHWFVGNPINNYGVNINIGDYAHFSETYNGIAGNLTMDYYVLQDHLKKAKTHFKQAPKMMEAFEHWFGPYPFYKDGYKLVEVPYLGMEHQSSVTYGNQFKNGYLGADLSGTGWGLKFDFIIIHESGHEWFANSITNKDIADMWIHESFTTYSENLYLEYYYGKEASSAYVVGTRKNIKNDTPIIGFYNVNKEGSTDMYYKGANMLHTLRLWINDDEKWRHILRGLNARFYHQTVTTQEIEHYISEASGIDLEAFFNQYLRTVNIPTLEYSIEKKLLKYRWTQTVENFEMPVKMTVDGVEHWILPKPAWQTLKLPSPIPSIIFDEGFYIKKNRSR